MPLLRDRFQPNMLAASGPKKLWIQSPVLDMVLFGYGWILIPSLLVIFQDSINTIILFVLLFNYVHRHYTFALVYGEKEEFEKRKNLYLGLPVAAVLITSAFVVAGAFSILLTISVLWTMFHSVTQKVGIARVYSRKAGYGEAWVEKGFIYSWFFYLLFALAQKESNTLLKYTSGRTVLAAIGNDLDIFTLISYGVFGVAMFFAFFYAYQEFIHRKQFSLPKNLYVLSTLLLYLIFTYSLVYGYIIFAFSHALEYIAFVNIFVQSKYKRRPDHTSTLAIASRRLGFYSTAFAFGVLFLCLVGRQMDQNAFSIYIVGSSFLHFIYDGWIWKIRKSNVGEPLGIKYASA